MRYENTSDFANMRNKYRLISRIASCDKEINEEPKAKGSFLNMMHVLIKIVPVQSIFRWKRFMAGEMDMWRVQQAVNLATLQASNVKLRW